MTQFKIISNDFDKYHQNNYNILLHLITTILSIVIVLSFVPSKFRLNLVTFYLILTKLILKDKLWLYNFIVVLVIFWLSNIINIKYKNKIYLLVCLIILQELSHYIFGEATYQSQYLFKKNGFNLLLYHTIFLLPLLINTLINKKDFV